MHKLFQTIKVEHDVPVEGIVKGEIPAWVRGSLYRNGPGMFEIGKDKYNHWFDGMALLQRFHIVDKKVTYQSRYLRSDAYKNNIAAQRITVSEFGTLRTPDPCQNIFRRFLSSFIQEPTDNCVVNLFPLQDELYAKTETNFIHRVDPDTLESIEKVDTAELIAVHMSTAHPHMDPDGTLHNLGMSCKDKLKICLIKTPPKKDPQDSFPAGEIVTAIDSSYKLSLNYIHSFAMTENYYIFVQQPLFINFLLLMANNARGIPMSSSMQYCDTIKVRFRIIDKRNGKEVNSHMKYEANPFMIFHHINAYEDTDHIVVDLCAETNAATLKKLFLQNLTSEECESLLRQEVNAEPRRYILPLCVDSSVDAGAAKYKNLVTLKHTTAMAMRQSNDTILCSYEILAETGFEFPQINYTKFNGKKYKYAFGVGFHRHAPVFNSLCKIELETKTFIEWQEENCYPSEPVFVANPDGKDEDDGVVLSAVNCTDFDQGKHAFLIVLDAKSMREIARAEFNVPRFPKDFHGLFRPT